MAKFATYASGAIWWPNLQLIQVVPSGGQIWNNCKWSHLVVIFATNESGVIWWPNLQLIQVAPSLWLNSQLMQVAPSWWPNLQLMHVAPSGGQIFKLCKWRHLVAKFATNVSGAILLPSSIQVTESISGSVVPLAMFGLQCGHLIPVL